MTYQPKITDVYLEDAHFNPTCNATIPGAWVAIVDGIKQAFAYPHEFDSVESASKYATHHFNDVLDIN